MLLVSVWSTMPASNLSYIFANESTLKKANDPLIISLSYYKIKQKRLIFYFGVRFFFSTAGNLRVCAS